MYALLESVRDALAKLPGVQTSKIGLEPNITPDDYPIVRVVPSKITPGSNAIERVVEVWIYFGAPIHESAVGIEGVYKVLFDLEAAIRNAMKTGPAGFGAKFVETVTDEDRLEHYKLFASRFELKILG